jgi:hypothetical protein
MLLNHGMLARVLTDLDPTFDNHDIHLQLLRREPIRFAEALLDFKKRKDPFKAFSGALVKWVGHEFRGQIRKNPEQRWEKVDPRRPIL